MEIQKAIKALINTSKLDNILGDLMKADYNICFELLYPLIREAWEKNTIPNDGRRA